MIDWVDEDFKQWAKYFGGNAVYLGYPTESIESKMMRFGSDGVTGGGSSQLPMHVPERVELTESAIRSMCHYDKRLIVVAYTIMVSRERQAKVVSDLVGYRVDRRQFMSDLHAGQKWYAGYLEHRLRKNVDTCAQKSV